MNNEVTRGECDYCGMHSGDAETLVEHQELHLNRPDFQYIECDRVLSKKGILKRHMPVHVRAIFQMDGIFGRVIKMCYIVLCHIT